MQDHILKLVSEALSDLEIGNIPLSAVIRMCIRIARLRNDFINLMWLMWETINFLDQNQRVSVLGDVFIHLTNEQYTYLRKKFGEAWTRERECAVVNDDMEIVYEDNVLPKPVGEIEFDIERFRQQVQDTTTPQGLHPLDLYFVNEANTRTRTISRILETSYKAILERIRNRVHEFLSQTERQLMYGQIHADIFEKNRLYVEVRLGELCPEALAQFTAGYGRAVIQDPEAMAQAMLSARRLLKSLADVLYPPKDQPVIGIDGKQHDLGEEHYIARLWQFVYDKASNSTSGQLLQSQVQDLGFRLDKLYGLLNKGLHAQIDPFEFNQCLLQTYLSVGDLLRIADNMSAINVEPKPDTAQT